MLFNSYEFILLFLPLSLIGFFLINRWRGREAAIVWLVIASLLYYGWWNPRYLLLILLSMAFNFSMGRLLGGTGQPAAKKLILTTGVGLNLALLAYFKYANFFVNNLNALGASFSLEHIVLPLAISFFTFQQIAYLFDASSGLAREYRFTHYALFVCFFPQLIAGPIVHHSEMMPQFMRDDGLRPRSSNIAVGLTIFAIGLCKKVVIADGVAVYATPVFDAAARGETLDFFRAWGGALAYTMQLYFDFSGYSDMAIGSARLFGIKLPINFFSPYKATSIIEFWRRWHMTLSRFLRDYLYIPLGGNRKSDIRRYTNLAITMLLGGLWHGAGWTFVFWGGLHGLYLVINHGWHWLLQKAGAPKYTQNRIWKAWAWLCTFFAVVIGWVFFRAESFDVAIAMLQGMIGINGVAIPNTIAARLDGSNAWLSALGVDVYLGGGANFVWTYSWVLSLLALSLIAPNTHQLLRNYRPAVNDFRHDSCYAIQPFRRGIQRLRWKPAPVWGTITAALMAAGILGLTRISEFLYFQF